MKEIIIGERRALQETYTIMPYEASCKEEQVHLWSGYPTVLIVLRPGYEVDDLAQEMFPTVREWQKDDWGYRIPCKLDQQLYLWQILDRMFKKFYDQHSRKRLCDHRESGFEIRYHKSENLWFDYRAQGYISRLNETIPGFDLPADVIACYNGVEDIDLEHVTKRDETCYIYTLQHHEIGVHCRGSWPGGSWDYFTDYITRSCYHKNDPEYQNQLKTLNNSMMKAKKTLILN